MDFRQLRTFSCVAELGSLSKASVALPVAQPALSRQIKLLEHELRAELFTRNGRGMVLTEAGRLLPRLYRREADGSTSSRSRKWFESGWPVVFR
jgi:DNA-binding transcriptional LysR family regulator